MIKLKAISPAAAAVNKQNSIPDFVFEAVNQLLSKEARKGNNYIKLLQKDIVALIVANGQCSKEAVYASKWLDFEESYREAGWEVTYDKPGYNESYEANFIFEAKV